MITVEERNDLKLRAMELRKQWKELCDMGFRRDARALIIAAFKLEDRARDNGQYAGKHL